MVHTKLRTTDERQRQRALNGVIVVVCSRFVSGAILLYAAYVLLVRQHRLMPCVLILFSGAVVRVFHQKLTYPLYERALHERRMPPVPLMVFDAVAQVGVPYVVGRLLGAF